MSNCVTLTAIKVETVLGEVSYGYIVRDNYASYYNDLHDSSILELSGEELIKRVDDDIKEVVDESTVELWCYAVEHGLRVNELWFDTEEIAEIVGA